MTPVCIPSARSIFLISHDRVNIFSWSEILASPFQSFHLSFGRMVSVYTTTFPWTSELIRLDGFQLIEKGESVIFSDVLTLDKFFGLLLGWSLEELDHVYYNRVCLESQILTQTFCQWYRNDIYFESEPDRIAHLYNTSFTRRSWTCVIWPQPCA